jgi:hypothetical protein
MTSWLVRVEGVNFDATVYDTNDLSTVRGGSLALLKLGEEVAAALRKIGIAKPELVYSGASQCVFTFDRSGDEASVAQAVRSAITERLRSMPGGPNQPPLAQMTIVIDIAKLPDRNPQTEDKALKQAEARNHTQQFRGWTIAPLPFDPLARQADPFDRVRPASEMTRLPHDKVNDPYGDDQHGQRCELSVSVARRRDYGRRARQSFYAEELTGSSDDLIRMLTNSRHDPRIMFADSFQDIVAGGEQLRRVLPPALENKIAVVYADGNSFGKIREDKKVGPKRFSKEIGPLRRKLLAAVLRWYLRGIDDPRYREAFAVEGATQQGKRRLGLRLETLLWGGDELVFVMPAWLVFGFLRGFFDETAGWQIDHFRLTHAVGVVIAHVKTPIRQMQQIAKEAANMAKDAGLRDTNSVTFEIFESLAPPDTGLAGQRATMFGAAEDELERLTRWLAIPGEEFAEFDRRMGMLKGVNSDDGFPRSQIYDALRAVRRKGGMLIDSAGTKAVEDHLAAYSQRAGGAAKRTLLDCHLPPDWPDGPEKRPAPMALYLISQLWDYARPFETNLPEFAAAKGAVS